MAVVVGYDEFSSTTGECLSSSALGAGESECNEWSSNANVSLLTNEASRVFPVRMQNSFHNNVDNDVALL